MFQDKNKAPPLDILELKLKGLESRLKTRIRGSPVPLLSRMLGF